MTNIEQLIDIYAFYQEEIKDDYSLQKKEAELIISDNYYLGDNFCGAFYSGKQKISIYRSCNLKKHFIFKYLLGKQIRVIVFSSNEIIEDTKAVHIAETLFIKPSELKKLYNLNAHFYLHTGHCNASEIGHTFYSTDKTHLTVKFQNGAYHLNSNIENEDREYLYESIFYKVDFDKIKAFTKKDIKNSFYYISVINPKRNIEYLFHEPNKIITFYIDFVNEKAFYPDEKYLSLIDRSVKYSYSNEKFKELLKDFEIKNPIKYFKGNKNSDILELIELNMEN